MVSPMNRLRGMQSLASTVLGAGIGAVAAGVSSAAQGTAQSAAKTGVQAAGDTFAKLARSVLKPLGERGLAGLTKIPRGTGRLGWRREHPAASGAPTLGKPTGSGPMARSLTGRDSAMSRLEGWGDRLSTIGDLSQQSQLSLQNAMQKTNQTLSLLSNMMKSLHDTMKGVVGNIR